MHLVQYLYPMIGEDVYSFLIKPASDLQKLFFLCPDKTSRCEKNDGQCIPRLLSPTLICVCFEIFWMFCIFVSVRHLIISRMAGDEQG